MWYAVRTEEGQEETARQKANSAMSGLTHDRWRVLYCVKKKRYLGQWHDERKCFLPGYLFLVTEGFDSVLIGADRMKGIFGADGGFGPVRGEEASLLERLSGGTEEIGMSYGVIRNGVLEISDGALMGMESWIRRIDRHKRQGYISMKIHDRETIASIGLEIQEKI